MSRLLKIASIVIALFVVSTSSICQVPDFARVPNLYDGDMPELSSPDRQKYAPVFYHGSSSFVEFLANQYGLELLLDAISFFQKEHEVIETKTGKTISVLKTVDEIENSGGSKII